MKIYTSLHHRLRNQHLAIEETTANISFGQMTISPAPCKWNIHDNIAHLAKYQIIFIERINKILNEETPFFERYKAEEDAGFTLFQNLGVTNLIKCIKDQRRVLIDLTVSLPEKDLQRIGIHKKYGRLNIVQWLEFFLLHEAHHMFTIFQLAYDTELQNKTMHDQF